MNQLGIPFYVGAHHILWLFEPYISDRSDEVCFRVEALLCDLNACRFVARMDRSIDTSRMQTTEISVFSNEIVYLESKNRKQSSRHCRIIALIVHILCVWTACDFGAPAMNLRISSRHDLYFVGNYLVFESTFAHSCLLWFNATLSVSLVGDRRDNWLICVAWCYWIRLWNRLRLLDIVLIIDERLTFVLVAFCCLVASLKLWNCLQRMMFCWLLLVST